MGRETYDRTAAEWRTACDATKAAGGDTMSIPTLHLTLILHGYEQLQAERLAAIDLISHFDDRGVHPIVIAELRHALGVISREDLANTYRGHGAELPEQQQAPESQMWQLAVEVPRGEAPAVCRMVESLPGAKVYRAWPVDGKTTDQPAAAWDPEGCVDHAPIPSASCPDCTPRQGVHR